MFTVFINILQETIKLFIKMSQAINLRVFLKNISHCYDGSIQRVVF